MANTPGPGPWTVESASENIIAVRDSAGQLQLIATPAVPDLLQACRVALGWLNPRADGAGIRSQLEAAIRKAEGR
jgi:hypothetical protein